MGWKCKFWRNSLEVWWLSKFNALKAQNLAGKHPCYQLDSELDSDKGRKNRLGRKQCFVMKVLLLLELHDAT